jgi:hypothetical protein
LRNELPLDIHLLKEGEDEKEQDVLDHALDQLLVEENDNKPRVLNESFNVPQLSELASLGLDLKDSEDSEANNHNISNSAD